MNKLTILGLLLWIVSGVLVGFQALSTLMQTGNSYQWNNLSMGDVIDAQYLSWVDTISFHYLQQAIEYIINMPMFLLFIALGVICFIINGFRRP